MEDLQGITAEVQKEPLDQLEQQRQATASQLAKCKGEIVKVKAEAREAIEEVAVGLRKQWQSSLSQHMDQV